MSEFYSRWALDSSDWIQRLNENRSDRPDEYILKNPGDSLVAEQLFCYPKAEQKFPTWHKPGLVYTKLSLEQSSGEFAALYKTKLIYGEEVWDLTGGLGMDSAAFSRQVKLVHHNEPNEALSRIAQHNHSLCGINNINYHRKLAEQLIEEIDSTDTIYLDPSRRSESGRTFLLTDCVPNVIQLLPSLKQKASRIIIKLSPIYDLKRVMSELPDTKQIHVVSVKGEVREILAILDESLPNSIVSVILPENYILTHNQDSDSKATPSTSEVPTGKFLHVADPAIYKAGTLTEFAQLNNLTYWGKGGYLFSDSPNIIGSQSYKVIESMIFKPKELKKRLKGLRVNIHKRNFPVEIASLYKSLSTNMGDDYHLFFTTVSNGVKAVCITEPPLKL